MKFRNVFKIGLFIVMMMVVIGAASSLRAEGTPTAAVEAKYTPDCSLLDNPEARFLMSGMFETRLLLACGRADELGAVASVGGGEGILLGSDVLVNNPAPEVAASSRTQSETSIAVNENTGTICSGYNDAYHGVIQGQGYTGFSSSTDGGATFVDHGALSASSFGDPSVIWRKSDGKFYFFALHTSGLGLWRSDNDCTSFVYVTNAHSGSGDDKELATVDNNPASPFYGRIYMAWTDFAVGGGTIRSTWSDNTTTWSAPVNLAGPSVQGAWPTTAPNGDVYISWVRWNPYYTGPINIQVVRSTNGGVNFSAVTDPMSGEINPRASGPTASCGRPALNGNIRYLPSPQIAVGPNGNLHIVYSYDQDGLNTGDVIDVFYRRSTTNGATWDPEVQLNDDGTLTDQFFPTVSVGASGRVVTSWYDRRHDVGGNLMFDYYMRASDDGGTTWPASQRVSDVSSPVVLDPNLATCYHGDYDQQTQFNGMDYIQWSDDRTVVSTDPNVWFDQNGGMVVPVVVITNPNDSDTLSGSILIEADALNFTPSKVYFQVLVGGTTTTVCADNSFPYSCSWDTTQYINGNYKIKVIGKDSVGGLKYFDQIRVRVSNP